MPAALPAAAALGCFEEGGDGLQLLVRQVRKAGHRAPGLDRLRVPDPPDPVLLPLALRANVRQLGGAEVLRALAGVDVAVQAPDLREDVRAVGNGILGALEAILREEHAAGGRGRLLGRRALVGGIPIEAMTISETTTATGRRAIRRSRRRSRKGSANRRIIRIVGIPTVPRMTDSGHLKIRSR